MRFFKNLLRKETPPVCEPVSPVETPVSPVETPIEEFEKKLLNMVLRDEWNVRIETNSLFTISFYQHASGITLRRTSYSEFHVREPVPFGLTKKTSGQIRQIFHEKEKAMEGNKKRADARFLTQFIDGEWPYRVASTTELDINPDLLTENKAMAFHLDGEYRYFFRDDKDATFYSLLIN